MVRLKVIMECLRFDTRVHMVRMVVCRVILLTKTACLLLPNIGYENRLGMLDIAIRSNEIIKNNLYSNLFLNVQIVGAKVKYLKRFNLFCIL